MVWNYVSIPKLQRWYCWSLGIFKQFHLAICWACDYLSMIGLRLIALIKRVITGTWTSVAVILLDLTHIWTHICSTESSIPIFCKAILVFRACFAELYRWSLFLYVVIIFSSQIYIKTSMNAVNDSRYNIVSYCCLFTICSTAQHSHGVHSRPLWLRIARITNTCKLFLDAKYYTCKNTRTECTFWFIFKHICSVSGFATDCRWLSRLTFCLLYGGTIFINEFGFAEKHYQIVFVVLIYFQIHKFLRFSINTFA